jgi:hypothetical protein
MATRRLGLGIVLGAIGGLGLVLGPRLGLTELGRPGTFLAGFGVGLMVGSGLALAVAGLLARVRTERWPARREHAGSWLRRP